MNEFKRDLKYSELQNEELFWERVYKIYFPTMVNCMLCSGDTASQRMGIDRIVYLANNQVIRIDEKKRRENYNDILLEYLSNNSTGAPGWIEKDLFIDFIAYAIMPAKKVYLLSWLPLKRAWGHYKEEWKSKYKKVIAKNEGYETHSVAVPIETLFNAISHSLIITVEDKE